MASYLLTWNPDSEWAHPWEVMAEFPWGNWNTAINFRNIKADDDLWFLKQGQEPRGIFAHAIAWGDPFPASNKKWFVEYWMDWIVNPDTSPEKMILRDELTTDPLLQDMNWDPQCSGPHIPPEIHDALWQKSPLEEYYQIMCRYES